MGRLQSSIRTRHAPTIVGTVWDKLIQPERVGRADRLVNKGRRDPRPTATESLRLTRPGVGVATRPANRSAVPRVSQ